MRAVNQRDVLGKVKLLWAMNINTTRFYQRFVSLSALNLLIFHTNFIRIDHGAFATSHRIDDRKLRSRKKYG